MSGEHLMTDEYALGALGVHLYEYGINGVNMNDPGNDADSVVDRWLASHDAEVRAAAKAEQREADAAITDGPHPANSGLDSFTLAHIGFAIRAAGTETGETS